jgi:hypothetical protein
MIISGVQQAKKLKNTKAACTRIMQQHFCFIEKAAAISTIKSWG